MGRGGAPGVRAQRGIRRAGGRGAENQTGRRGSLRGETDWALGGQMWLGEPSGAQGAKGAGDQTWRGEPGGEQGTRKDAGDQEESGGPGRTLGTRRGAGNLAGSRAGAGARG